MASLSLVTPSSGEILAIQETKEHARIDLTDDDAWIWKAIPAASDAVEDRTSRQLLQATWVKRLDRWPCEGWIEIPRPPLVSISSITYLDTAGVTQTWGASNYRVDAPAGRTCSRGKVALAYGATFPVIQDVMNAISITFVGGYGTTAYDVPAKLRLAMDMLIAHWYRHREAVLIGTISKEIEFGFESLVGDYISHATQR